MDLRRSLAFNTNEVSFKFRTIRKADVNQEYIDGLRTQYGYIENVPSKVTLKSQKQYVNGILTSASDTICGLFMNGSLVGTAGIQLSLSNSFLQNVDVPVKELATVGIFIFNKNNRGKGFGKTMVWAATYLFHKCTGNEWFGAGMEKENIPSYKSFHSCGFHEIFNDKKYNKVLIHISKLKKPELITGEKIQQHEISK